MAADDFLAICDVICVPYDYFNDRLDDWKEVVSVQAIIANGSADEIAALALAVQERQSKFVPCDSETKYAESKQKCSYWCNPTGLVQASPAGCFLPQQQGTGHRYQDKA